MWPINTVDNHNVSLSKILTPNNYSLPQTEKTEVQVSRSNDNYVFRMNYQFGLKVALAANKLCSNHILPTY